MGLIPTMLKDICKLGYSTSDLKECVIRCLSPFFINQNALDQCWCDVKMLSVFEFIIRYHYDEAFSSEIESILKIYREAFSQDPIATMNIVTNDIDSFTQKENIMWSIRNQKKCDDNDPEEVAISYLRHIGDILEIGTKHVVAELWSLIQIIEDSKTDYESVRKLEFGVTVNNIISKGYLNDMLVLGSNSQKISDWRNIAYHHTYRFVNENRIVCTYGKKQNRIELTLKELKQLAHQITRISNVINMARSIVMFDYSAQLHAFCSTEELEGGVLSFRKPMMIEGIRVSMLSQGFSLEAVEDDESEVVAQIIDVGIANSALLEKKHERWIHVSQFLVHIWSVIPKERVKIKYYNQEDKLEFICSVSGEICDKILNRGDPLSSMAPYVDMKIV